MYSPAKPAPTTMASKPAGGVRALTRGILSWRERRAVGRHRRRSHRSTGPSTVHGHATAVVAPAVLARRVARVGRAGRLVGRRAGRAGDRAAGARGGYLTWEDFVALCAWKSPRSRPRVAGNDPAFVEAVTRTALSTPS